MSLTRLQKKKKTKKTKMVIIIVVVRDSLLVLGREDGKRPLLKSWEPVLVSQMLVFLPGRRVLCIFCSDGKLMPF